MEFYFTHIHACTMTQTDIAKPKNKCKKISMAKNAKKSLFKNFLKH